MKKTTLLLLLLLSFTGLKVHAVQFSEQADSLKTTLVNAGDAINSPYSDFAPVVSADGMVMMFTSRRPVTEKEIKSGKPTTERVFISTFNKENETWSKALPIGPEVNKPGRNNSAIAVSHDGQRLLIFRDDINGNGDIYESVLSGNRWSEAVKLPEPVNSDYHESSACYSYDRKTLYFVSNRKGGQGGRDIWYTTKKTGNDWNNPVNMGTTINTREDEEGVFLHPDGTSLYFSSKGHNTTGGYDLMISQLVNGMWTAPVNSGKPLNTPGQDVFFVLQANGIRGYYASSAAGGFGNEDIYIVNFEKIKRGPKLAVLKGKIFDEKTGEPVAAEIEIANNQNLNEKFSLNSNSSTGNFLLTLPSGKNYGITVNGIGYLFHSENFFMPDSADYIEIEKNIGLKKLEVGSTIVLNNIFYDFDKSTLRNESVNELDKLADLLTQNNTITIELSSHTDGKGAEDYNVRLSQARAQSVVDYLKGKGIPESRLIPKGYGKSKPVATNETEEGRQLNRRTEFKIISK